MAQRLVEADGTELTGTVILGEWTQNKLALWKSPASWLNTCPERKPSNTSQRHRGFSFLLMTHPGNKKKSYAACPLLYCFISILLLCIRRLHCLVGRFWCGSLWKTIFKKKKRTGQKQMHINKQGGGRRDRLCPCDLRSACTSEITWAAVQEKTICFEWGPLGIKSPDNNECAAIKNTGQTGKSQAKSWK